VLEIGKIFLSICSTKLNMLYIKALQSVRIHVYGRLRDLLVRNKITQSS